MKVIRETSRRYMALLIVFAMLAGIFPVGVFADTNLESYAETNIIQEYEDPEGAGTYIEPEADTLEIQLTDAEKIAAVKVDVLTVIDNLAVSNETTDIDILTAAQSETLYGVVVEWDDENGFSKTDATSSAEGSITGTLMLVLNLESDYVLIDKIIEQLPISDDENLNESDESSAGTLEPIKEDDSEIALEDQMNEQLLPEEDIREELIFMPMELMTTSTNIRTLPSTSVDNSSQIYVPGFYVGTNDTLTYNGTGTLTFEGGLQAAGIGGKGVNNGSNTASIDSFIGDVVFGEAGQVGNFYITAYGGEWAAGIGDGDTNQNNTELDPSRSVTINSGIVIGYADKAAGIGTQDNLQNTNMVLDFRNTIEGSFAVGASSYACGIGAGQGASMKSGNLKVAGYVMGLATGTNFPISEQNTVQAAAINPNWTIYSFTLTGGVGTESRIYVTKEGSDLPVYDYTIPTGYTKLAISLKVGEKYTILFGNQGYKYIQTTAGDGGKFVNETISPSSLGFAATVNLGSNMSLDAGSGPLSQGGSTGTTITPIKIKANNGYQLPASWSVGNGLIYTRNTASTATITGTIQSANVIVTAPDATFIESGIQTSTGSSSYTISGDGVSIDPNLTIDYAGDISEASVLIRNLIAGDKLSYTTVNGISGTYNPNTGILALSGAATARNYQEALRSVKFSTTSSTTDDRIIDFVLGSGLYFNDHFYEYVPGRLTWGEAKEAAENRSLFGRQGYLVTITSQAENDFVSNKTLGLGWIGARDINRDLANGEYLTGGLSSGLSNGDWRWVTGPEGLMDSGKGLKFYSGYFNNFPSKVAGQFNNWASLEPNNSPSEWVVHIYEKDLSTNSGKWNDFHPANTSVQGYIVEYGGMTGDSDIKVQDFKVIEVNDTYTIIYELNGGIVSANPETYTSQSEVTLNNPTREGYSFVGWTGSNGTTAQTNVTIATGSTGNKSYTANWKANAPTSAPLDSIVTVKTDTSFTITTVEGYEYSVNGTNWHSGTAGSLTFTGLTAGTNYDLVYRKAAVTTGDNPAAAGDASPALAVMTKYAPNIGISVDPTSQTYPGNVILTTTLTGAETLGGKTIIFYDGSDKIGESTTDTSGKASLLIESPTVYTYSFRAELDGDQNNMSASSSSLSYTVTKGTQTVVSFENSQDIIKTYGDSLFTLPDVSGGSGTGEYSYRSSDEEVVKVEGNAVTIIGAGVADIYVEKLGDANYNDSNEASIRVSVAKKPVTISGVSAGEKDYDGNDVATILMENAVIEGLVNQDTVSIDSSNAAATFSDVNAGTGITVTFTDFALSGAGAANYTLESQPASVTADILLRPLTMSNFTAEDKIYDGTTTAIGSFTTNNVLEGEVVEVLYTANFDTRDAAGNKTVSFTGFTLSGADAANYTITTTTGSAAAKITKRPLTITLLDKSKNYGELDPVFEAGYNSTESGGMGFGEGDDVTTLGNLRMYRLQGNDAGNYPIRYQIFEEKNHNYILTMVEGSLTIEPKEITLSEITANDKIYDGTTDATGTLTISGVLQEDDVQAAGTFTFADKNAGANKAVNVTEITLTGVKGGNYTIVSEASTTAAINKRSLDLSNFTAGDKTYDGTDGVDGTGFEDNRLSEDDLSFTYTAHFTDKNAGDDKEVHFTDIVISGGTDKDNYALSVTSGTAIASISKKELTAVAIADDKLYDGTTVGTGTISVTGKITGDDLDEAGAATFEFEDENVGNKKKVTASNITLSGTDKDNYSVTGLVETTASIGKQVLKMVAENKSKSYGNSFDPEFTVSWEGFQNDETEADLGGYYTIFREVGESAGLYDIWIINNLTTPNYNIQVFDGNNNEGMTYGTFTIEKLALTITADSAEKTYDGTALQAGGWTHTGTIAAGETIESIDISGSQLFAGSSDNSASGAIIKKGTADVTGNYDITYIPGTLTIDQASIEITVTSSGDTKEYDGTALTNTGSSVTSGTLATNDSLAVTVSGSISNVGTTANTISEVKVLHGKEQVDVTENYVIRTSEGTLEVTKRSITITADSGTKVYDGTPLNTTGSSVTTGSLLSGHSYNANVSGRQLFVGSSTSSISEASIVDENNNDVTGNYNITYETGNLTVEKAFIEIHVTADSKNKVYDGIALEAGYTNTGTLATNDSLAVTVSGTITNVGTTDSTISEVKVLHGKEQVDVTENYVISTSEGTLEVTKRSITITAASGTKVYDGMPLTTTDSSVTTGTLLSGNNYSAIVEGSQLFAGSSVSSVSGAIILDENNEDVTGNYNITYETGNLIVEKASIPIHVTAESKNKVYDGSALEAGYTNTGTLATNDSLAVTVSGSITNAGTTPNTISEVKVLHGTEEVDVTENYMITTSEGTLTINKKALTVTVGNYNKVYGSENPGFEVNVTGFVNEESPETAIGYTSPTASTTAVIKSDVGEYTITISGGEANNYSFDYSEGVLRVSVRPLIITADNKSKYEVSDDPDLTYTITSGQVLAGDSITVVLVREKGEEVGSYGILKKSIAISENYEATFIPGSFNILRKPSGGGGSSTPSTPSTPQESTNTNVIVNGEPVSAGTETKTTEDGKTTNLVQVNNEVIDSKIEEAIKDNNTGLGNAIQISTADKDSQVIAFELTGDIVKKLENNAFNVSVKNNDIEYIIPAKEFIISKVAETLNIKEKDLKEIKVGVKITKPNEQLIESYNQLAKANGAELVFPPVSFEVVAKTTRLDGTTEEVRINKFSNYVERVMEIPSGIDQSKVSTGIVFNSDGTYSHVPTEIFQKDGKWYARINSLTNSTYSLIWSPVTVKSVENHWSKDIVNNMASRLIIKNPEGFMPNQNITRGEFAEYITKALGINRSGVVNTQKFSDVASTHELAYSIEIASEYGIISGYPDGTFKPDAQISREEAMVMYSRAMDIAGLAEKDIDRINSYTDKDSIAEWAYNDVRKTISAGVFNGKTHETINPKDTLTCAEAATAIRNLLIQADLINK